MLHTCYLLISFTLESYYKQNEQKNPKKISLEGLEQSLTKLFFYLIKIFSLLLQCSDLLLKSLYLSGSIIQFPPCSAGFLELLFQLTRLQKKQQNSKYSKGKIVILEQHSLAAGSPFHIFSGFHLITKQGDSQLVWNTGRLLQLPLSAFKGTE